jgi:hypothetical protein
MVNEIRRHDALVMGPVLAMRTGFHTYVIA